MSFGDMFKGKENTMLRMRIAQLEAMFTPEMRNLESLLARISAEQANLNYLVSQVESRRSELLGLQQNITQARANLIETNEEVLMQSFGLYRPHFSFANSTGYKDKLTEIRLQQKECIKNDYAATGAVNWTVNGDAKKGAKMVSDTKKLLLRAFNNECDDVIEHVKFNNVDAAVKRINTAAETISKLGITMSIAITPVYVRLKISELYLAYEYQMEKQKEKDQLKQLRADERERAKLEREIEEARKKIEKEQKHYSNALLTLNKQISCASPEELPALEAKKSELQGTLAELGKSMEDIDYRAANQKAGYVYVISNVGSFGEGVYKIGMTRRLEPMDRVEELGDASVPFDFDVHALIFSDDAPGLEAALHRAFEDRKVNMVNTRREFFRVSLDEIKRVILDNYDKTVEFVDIAPAEQYRESELIRKKQ